MNRIPAGSLAEAKASARAAAVDRRAEARAAADHAALDAHLREALAPFSGATLAGYLPIRTEADPRRAMAAWSETAPLCLPVVLGAGKPLEFRSWRPGQALAPGAFGVDVPAAGAILQPDILIVPLLAFDAAGYRLGYGGGFYDRTLAALRAKSQVTAIGLAFAGQKVPACPREPTDAPLDLIVTERGVIRPAPHVD